MDRELAIFWRATDGKYMEAEKKYRKNSILRKVFNRVIHQLARIMPGARSIRPFLHRLRGVSIGRNVFIADDVYLENEYPEQIEIHDDAQIGIRSTVLAHNRGAGKVIIEKQAYIGPGCVIIASAGSTLTIGQGSVIGALSVISTSVPSFTFVRAAPPKVIAKVTTPLSATESYGEFIRGLEPIRDDNPESTG